MYWLKSCVLTSCFICISSVELMIFTTCLSFISQVGLSFASWCLDSPLWAWKLNLSWNFWRKQILAIWVPDCQYFFHVNRHHRDCYRLRSCTNKCTQSTHCKINEKLSINKSASSSDNKIKKKPSINKGYCMRNSCANRGAQSSPKTKRKSKINPVFLYCGPITYKHT